MTSAGRRRQPAADGAAHRWHRPGSSPRPLGPMMEATEAALRADRRLTEAQKRALTAVYRSYIEARGPARRD